MTVQRHTNEQRKLMSIRITPSELADIDRRARALDLTRTDYMIRASLRQPLGDEGFEERVSDLEQRLARLEELAFHG